MPALHHITQPATARFIPQSQAAMVTCAIGDRYFADWRRLAEDNWLRYASRHQMDLIVISDWLDPSPQGTSRSPSWQKCLTASQPWSQHYERLVWVDADILINPHAPDITRGVPREKVGAAISASQLSLAEKQVRMERLGLLLPTDTAPTFPDIGRAWGSYQNQIYRQVEGLEVGETRIIQAGVLVFSPHLHRPLLEECYRLPQNSNCYEQMPLSLLLFQNGLHHELNPRFNWLLWEASLLHFPRLVTEARHAMSDPVVREWIATQLDNSYFLHFAALFDLMRRMGGASAP